MQTDFCGKGGYVDRMGYDLSLTRAPIEPIRTRARRDARRGLSRHPHPRGPPPGPLRSAREQALALAADRRGHRRSRALRARSSCAASRAGRSSRSWRRWPGEAVIDKPGKGSFCATDLELILRTRGITQPRADRHHHRRVRAHDHARGQRPRLRVPAARGLHRRHRPRQSPGRAQDGQDAGRRVRRRRPTPPTVHRGARLCQAALSGSRARAPLGAVGMRGRSA